MTMALDQRFVTRDADDLARVAARWLAGRIARKPGRFSLALCGGSTPMSLYRLLGTPDWAGTLDWSRVHVFWGDERLVSRSDPASNAGNARQAWLDHVPIPAANLHMMPIQPDPDAAALRYARTLHDFYGSDTLTPGQPLFDVVLLGVGTDGHTASLFPDDPALGEHHAWVRAVRRSDPPARLSLTLPVLRSARSVAFLVSGQDKADVMHRLAAGEQGLPAAQVQGEEQTVWFLDRAAARELT